MPGVFRFLSACALLLVLFSTACSAPQSDEPQPPEIQYGLDMCDACGMSIDDPRFASATLLKDGAYRKFDDIGDMIVYHMDHPDQQVAAWFVHDHDSEEWIRAEEAFYVISKEIESPMGFGIFAFVTYEAAEKYADELTNAKVMDFENTRADVHVNAHG
jgi:copper chaperone NosL